MRVPVWTSERSGASVAGAGSCGEAVEGDGEGAGVGVKTVLELRVRVGVLIDSTPYETPAPVKSNRRLSMNRARARAGGEQVPVRTSIDRSVARPSL